MLDHAYALLTLADVLETRGLLEDAEQTRSGAVELFRAKGNIAAAARFDK